MDLKPLVLEIVLSYERMRAMDPTNDLDAYRDAVIAVDELITRLGQAVLLGKEDEAIVG